MASHETQDIIEFYEKALENLLSDLQLDEIMIEIKRSKYKNSKPKMIIICERVINNQIYEVEYPIMLPKEKNLELLKDIRATIEAAYLSVELEIEQERKLKEE